MPIPVSATDTSNLLLSISLITISIEPLLVYFTALFNKLRITL